MRISTNCHWRQNRIIWHYAKGTTLVEMVIYLAIASGLLVSVGAIALATMDAKAKARSMNTVLASAEFAFSALAQAFSNPGTLVLPMPVATSSSAVFIPDATMVAETYQVVDGRLVRERAGGDSEPFTPIDVVVDHLEFAAIGDVSTSTGVRVQMTISARAFGPSNVHHYRESFSTSYLFGGVR